MRDVTRLPKQSSRWLVSDPRNRTMNDFVHRGGNADNPNGWIERGINVDFVIIRPYREPSMGILTVFSQPPTGIELIAFSLFRIRCSADRCSWDERRKIK